MIRCDSPLVVNSLTVLPGQFGDQENIRSSAFALQDEACSEYCATFVQIPCVARLPACSRERWRRKGVVIFVIVTAAIGHPDDIGGGCVAVGQIISQTRILEGYSKRENTIEEVHAGGNSKNCGAGLDAPSGL